MRIIFKEIESKSAIIYYNNIDESQFKIGDKILVEIDEINELHLKKYGTAEMQEIRKNDHKKYMEQFNNKYIKIIDKERILNNTEGLTVIFYCEVISK